jgi:hypothetical protein
MPNAQQDAYLTLITGLDVAKARTAAAPLDDVGGASANGEAEENGATVPASSSGNGRPASHAAGHAGDTSSPKHTAHDGHSAHNRPAEHSDGSADSHHGESAAHGKAKSHHEGKEEHERKEGEEGEEGSGVKLKQEYTLGEWKIHALGGKVEVEFEISATAEMTIGGEGIEIGNSKEGIGLSAAKDLWESKKKVAIGGVDILSKPRFALEAGLGDGKATIATKFAVDIPIGMVEIAFEALEIKPPKHIEIGAISASLTAKIMEAEPFEVRGVPVKDIELSVTGKASIKPEYIKILVETVGKKVGAAVGEAVATAAGGEVMIGGSLVLVSLAVVVGGVTDMMQSTGISEVGDHRKMWRDKLMNGVYAAYYTQKTPSDGWEKVGYDFGMENITLLLKQVKKENPNLTDEQIQRITAQRAEATLDHLKKPFGDIAGQAAWDAWLKQNPKALRGVASASYVAAFEKPVDENDKNWKNWTSKQTLGGVF